MYDNIWFQNWVWSLVPKESYGGWVLNYFCMPNCNLFRLSKNDTCVQLLLCCKKYHLRNWRTNWHIKVLHIIVETLAHPNMCHFTLVYIGLQDNKCPVNTIPWFTSVFMLPFQNRLPATLGPHILCIKCKLRPTNPPFCPYPSLTIQFIEFIYWNNRFSTVATTHKDTYYHASDCYSRTPFPPLIS